MKLVRVLSVALAAVFAVSLASCSAVSGGSSDTVVAATTDSSSPSFEMNGPESADADTREVTRERSVIRTGNIVLEVESSSQAVEDVTGIAQGLGGTVISQSLSTHGGSTESGEATIQVPSDKIDAAFTQLSEIGTVQSQSQSADDVTEQHVDLDARVKSLQSAVDRLSELMAGATTTSELLEAESALSERQQELDGLRAQLESLEGQIDHATIWISVHEASALGAGGPKNFAQAVELGLSSIAAFAAGAVIATGVALPWLIAAVIIAAAIVIPLKLRRRRRSASAGTLEKPFTSPANSAESVVDSPER